MRLQLRLHADGAGAPLLQAFQVDRGVHVRLRRAFGEQHALVNDAIITALQRARGQDRLLDDRIVRTLERLDGAPHYRLMPGVVIEPAAEETLSLVAEQFYARRRKTLVVTSGVRTAESQARAMYLKLVLGVDLYRLYTKRRALGAVLRAYKRGAWGGLSDEAIVERMAQVIDRQAARGVYISPHLEAGAVDLRSFDLMRDDLRALRRLARRRRRWVRKLKVEHRPPHVHLLFRQAEPVDRATLLSYHAPEPTP